MRSCWLVEIRSELTMRRNDGRSAGDFHGYWHWDKVASEIARIEPRAEMDFDILKVLSDQEEPGRR